MHISGTGVVAALMVVASATTATAAVTTYLDPMAFMAAQTGMILEEDFEDATLIPGLSIMSSNGNVANGLFNDVVNVSGANTMFIKDDMTSFGGTFDLNPGGFGQGLLFSITLNDNSIVNAGSIFQYNGFFGFTSTDVFKKVTIVGFDASGGSQETYSLDNLKVSMVPEPATWALLISGFGLVGAVARRRRVAVSA